MMDVIQNFLVIAVIATFDDTFYVALGEDLNKQILSGDKAFEHLFTV